MFHTPGYPDNSLFTLEVIESLLSGRSGRLYKRLVTEENLCIDAGASNDIRLHNGSFQIWAELKNNADPARVEKILLEEIAAVTKIQPSAQEMDRVKNTIRMSYTQNLKSLEGISDRLAQFQRLGNWKRMLDYPDKIAAVKAEDIPAIAAQYFKPEFKVIGLLLPDTAGRASNILSKDTAR